LRDRSGNDFSLYKTNTLYRRIERRMAVHQVADLDGYVRYLRSNPQELDLLFKELLIGVTRFFRDPRGMGKPSRRGHPVIVGPASLRRRPACLGARLLHR
jgi:hypothetical protein